MWSRVQRPTNARLQQVLKTVLYISLALPLVLFHNSLFEPQTSESQLVISEFAQHVSQ